MAKCVKLEWATPPQILPCAVGEPGDFSNLSVIATYDTGESEVLAVQPRMFNESNLQATGETRTSLVILDKQKLSVDIELNGRTLDKIEVTPKPSLVCKLDEPLSREDIIVTAFYDDGSQREVQNYKTSPFGPLKPATDEITFKYGRCRVAFPIKPFMAQEPAQIDSQDNPNYSLEQLLGEDEQPSQPTIESIVLKTAPNKRSYIERETTVPSLDGAELALNMSDGQIQVIQITQDMVELFDIRMPGTTDLKIGYKGFSVSCQITVSSRTLVSLEIASPPKKTSYIENEPLLMIGLLLYACYDNGEKEPITDYEVDSTRAQKDSTEIVFSYSGHQVSCPITVEPLKIESISWIQKPSKTKYFTKEERFVCDGGRIRLKYNDNSTSEVTLTSAMVFDFDTSVAGVKQVLVRYELLSLPLDITVVERKPLSIKVLNAPKTDYIEGESFDTTDLIVEALFTGGSKEIVPVSYLPQGPLSPKIHQVVLMYEDKAAILDVRVSEKLAELSQEAEEVAPEQNDKPEVHEGLSEEMEENPSSMEPEEEPAEMDVEIAAVVIPDFYPSSFGLRFM